MAVLTDDETAYHRFLLDIYMHAVIAYGPYKAGRRRRTLNAGAEALAEAGGNDYRGKTKEMVPDPTTYLPESVPRDLANVPSGNCTEGSLSLSRSAAFR